MFNYMIDIIDIISEQIFDKSSTVPYAIRQFCKCLYQACKSKFGEKPTITIYQTMVRVISSFILDKWILQSVFLAKPEEGLINEFMLSPNCTQNMKLMHYILSRAMVWQDWELKTPQAEMLPGDRQPHLFHLPGQLSQ